MPAKKNANGQGTVCQRIDGRWCGSGYVLAADGTRKRVYGSRRSTRRMYGLLSSSSVAADDPMYI
jgi:hypothetical protein